LTDYIKQLAFRMIGLVSRESGESEEYDIARVYRRGGEAECCSADIGRQRHHGRVRLLARLDLESAPAISDFDPQAEMGRAGDSGGDSRRGGCDPCLPDSLDSGGIYWAACGARRWRHPGGTRLLARRRGTI
jgi:hypothetical protein